MPRILNNIEQIVFPSEVRTITFIADTTTKEESFKFILKDKTNNKTILEEDFYFYIKSKNPFQAEQLKMYDFGKIIQNIIETNDTNIIDFSIILVTAHEETTTIDFRALKCKLIPNITAEMFVVSNFLTANNKSKNTHTNSTEILNFYAKTGETINVTVNKIYLTNSGIESENATIGDAIIGDNEIHAIECSANKFVQDGKELLAYTIKAGERQQEYRLTTDDDNLKQCIIFKNSFGVLETLSFFGTTETETKIERSNANINGEQKTYHAKETTTYKISSGIMNEAAQKLFVELCKAKKVKLQSGESINITDSEFKRNDEWSTTKIGTITYVYADNFGEPLNIEKKDTKIFDETFDNTFN